MLTRLNDIHPQPLIAAPGSNSSAAEAGLDTVQRQRGRRLERRLAFVAVTFFLGQILTTAAFRPVRAESLPSTSFVPNELLISLTPEAWNRLSAKRLAEGLMGLPALDEQHSRLGVETITAVFATADPLARREGLARIFKVTLPPGSDVFSALDAYSKQAEVEFAELNLIYVASLAPSSATVEVRRGASETAEAKPAAVGIETRIVDGNRLAILSNDLLEVWISLDPTPDDDRGPWFAGAAVSWQLGSHRIEMLDRFRSGFSWLGHDLEKRCMQIDRIRLARPPWETQLTQEVKLFDQPYEVVSSSTGPVRACLMLASKDFDYGYSDLATGRERRLRCRLFRAISLYADADYLIEELYVKATPETAEDDDSDGGEAADLSFEARYIAHMDFGFGASLHRFPNIPDWFAVDTGGWPPNQAFGFATDVHAWNLANPGTDGRDQESSHKTFSWWLHPAKGAICLHRFGHCGPFGADSQIGHRWYELIFKPLRAGIGGVWV